MFSSIGIYMLQVSKLNESRIIYLPANGLSDSFKLFYLNSQVE